MKLFVMLVFSLSASLVQSSTKHKPEQGIFEDEIKSSSPKNFFKTLYNHSDITLNFDSTSEKCTYKNGMYINVTIIGNTCKRELENIKPFLHTCIKSPVKCHLSHHVQFLQWSYYITCNKSGLILPPSSLEWVKVKNGKNSTTAPSRKKRENNNTSVDSNIISDASPHKQNNTESTVETTALKTNKNNRQTFVQVPFLGEYVVSIAIVNEKNANLSSVDGALVKLIVKMNSSLGYLSAHEYPLLNFYLVMCIVYSIYAIFWFIMVACNCQDLLRVQYWIGFVIVLGLIEKVVYFSEYLNVNEIGFSNRNMEKFAGFVNCLKRAVSRILVIIISLGFGIVKPRLGSNLYKVLGIGFIYFIVALLVKMFEIDVYFNTGTREALLLLYLPLTIVDIVIIWWVFTSLLETMKTLRLRRNTTKLSLYRHFSNTIVLCSLVSLGMIIYFIYYQELGCSENFTSEWFETACWPLLFSIILFVIMILWRPTTNNKRYSYSPMLDGDDSEVEDAVEPMLGNGMTESIKIRAMKSNDLVKTDLDMTEKNLKWIDENIPPTVADAALPVVMDPEDLKKAVKYEMSKMD